jgi:hypothetical protein
MEVIKTDRNKEIQQFIDSLKKGFVVTETMVAFTSTYDKCDDYYLSEDLIKKTWHSLTRLGLMLKEGFVSVLHTNSGAGKFFKSAPSDLDITSYNLDFYCSTITDIVCDDRKKDFLYHSENKDIAQYFFQEHIGNNPKFDLVITQPTESKENKEHGLQNLDSDLNFSSLPCNLYYPLRSTYFLNEGGFLVVVLPRNMKENLIDIFNKYYEDNRIKFNTKMKFLTEIETGGSQSYNTYIFKNIGYGR